MAKKTDKNTGKREILNKNELINLIKIVAIVSLVLLIFYFITVLVDKRINKNSYKTDDPVAVIQYDKIIVGEILNRTENTYYVLVEKEDDPYIDLYKQYLDAGAIKYYTVDLSDVLNGNYISDVTYVEGNNPSTYKFSATTLLKVENRNLISAYSDHESIVQCLGLLIK